MNKVREYKKIFKKVAQTYKKFLSKNEEENFFQKISYKVPNFSFQRVRGFSQKYIEN